MSSLPSSDALGVRNSLGHGGCLSPLQPIPKLLLTAREAAALLSISPRKLWSLTASRELPCLRIGRSVRYSVESIRSFVAAKSGGEA